MLWHARGLEIPVCPARLADSGDRTPSNAMAASMSSGRRSSNGSRKTRPRTAAKGSTISASRGQGRGVVEVATLQRRGGSPSGSHRWRTLMATATLLSQRVSLRCCGRGPCLESLIGGGLARIPRAGCDNRGGAAPGVFPPRPVRRTWWGRKWRERPRVFWRWCGTGEGEVVHAQIHHLPSPFRGRSLHSDPWREGHRALPRSGRINRPIRFPHRGETCGL